MEPCSNCGRTFNQDVLERHEPICRKSKNSKRKVFDSSRQRIKGTEMETFAHKSHRFSSLNATPTDGINPARKKTLSWRKRHEDLIQTVRAAREINIAAKSGNPLPPPPPPSGPNPDYIQCQYCSRHFEPTTAERHIPFCKQQASKINRTPGQIDPKATNSLKKRTQYKPPSLKKKPTPSSTPSSSERVSSSSLATKKPAGHSVVRQNTNFGDTYTFTKPLYTRVPTINEENSPHSSNNNSSNNSTSNNKKGQTFSNVRSTAFSRVVVNKNQKGSPFEGRMSKNDHSHSTNSGSGHNTKGVTSGSSRTGQQHNSASRRLFAALEYSDHSSDEGSTSTTSNGVDEEIRERGREGMATTKRGGLVGGGRDGVGLIIKGRDESIERKGEEKPVRGSRFNEDMITSIRPGGASRFGRGKPEHTTEYPMRHLESELEKMTTVNDSHGGRERYSYEGTSSNTPTNSSGLLSAVFKEPVQQTNNTSYTSPISTTYGGMVMSTNVPTTYNSNSGTSEGTSNISTSVYGGGSHGRSNGVVPLNEYGHPMSKFCYECGSKFPVPQAKYCCECGTKRI